MFRPPWARNPLKEEVRKQRGKLAEAVVRNDRFRDRLSQSIERDTPVTDLFVEMFKRLDEARRD